MCWTLICVGNFFVSDTIVGSDIVCNNMLGGVVLKCDMVETIW